MFPRARALLLLALVALSAAAVPPADAQAANPVRCDPVPVRYVTCVEPLHFDPALAGNRDHFYRVAWRPVPTQGANVSLSDALIAGGVPTVLSGTSAHGSMVLYDGLHASRIWDKDGPQFVDVAWHPSGSYALAITDQKGIYRVDPPGPNRPQYTFRNLWDDCAHVQIVGCSDAYFQGRHVSFNPVTGDAWITGSSLLAYDGTDLSVVESGNDIAYRSVAWAPDGKTALLSALVCVNPNDVTVDVGCPANITAGDILPGRVILADTATSKLCEVYTYGQFNPQRAEVNDITWHPSGNYALIYGDDDFHGSLLKFDARRGSEGTTPKGCPMLGSSFQYVNPAKSEGEFNKFAYNAHLGRFWGAAGAGEELWESDGTRFVSILGEHDITGGRGTIFYGIAWDPTDTYALVSGYEGRLYKIVPSNAPFVRIATPKNNTLVTGGVTLGGQIFATSQFTHAGGVEGTARPVRLETEDAGDVAGWFDATLTATAGGLANYTYSWNASALPARYYRLHAQALQGADWIDLGARVVQAQPSSRAPDGGFDPLPPLDAAANFTYEWRPVPGQARAFTLFANATRAAIAAHQGQVAPSAVRIAFTPLKLAIVPAGPEVPFHPQPGSEVRGALNWSADWSTGGLAEGLYQLAVQGREGSTASNTARVVVQVVRPQALGVPSFAADQATNSSDGAYQVRWLPVEGPDLRYELEESALPPQFAQAGAVSLSSGAAFIGEERLVYGGPGTLSSVVGKPDGVYLYRVRARSPTGISAWSDPVAVRVAIDSDHDGWSDQQEQQCGSQITNATSTCTDIDGDGVPNAQDAFPLDPKFSKDSDGDGFADETDRFPLDYREWADTDNDTWGDNAERRLGSDPFNASSTPETDDDGDGCLNKFEASGNTDPRDPASGPAFCLRTRSNAPGQPANAPGFEAPAACAALVALALAVRRRRA